MMARLLSVGLSMVLLLACASSAVAKRADVIVASSSSTTFWAGFIGAVLGELAGKAILHRTAQKELAADEELRRRQLTERDETALKSIATALEEFSVDNGGKFPKTLADLSTTYLNVGARIIPGSDPIAYYTYEFPASNPSFGAFDIKDNGTFDPTLDRLHNAIDHTLCTHSTCTYIIYLENAGLFGI